ncbi:MAG: leucine--tRNA ligase [Bacteroidetes bacterium]|nr:leucine--tRNA ligase [Bacteroidota bacterium]MDA0903592.1 leucine--tRNA ligase [Bacteroidota bacterium]MDA1242101.1 leucine--tRNA ligase [Bacteroidota bacterium]
MDYDFRAIEATWQRKWKETEAYKVTEDSERPKFYVLDMFPYPSGAGLHVGHPLGYIASDVFARYKRHKGYNVLHPMGYDSFGLPAEQYAIQTGQHPAITTEENINRYRDQLEQLGFCYDWSREVRTSDPSYYRWTQWIFGELFESWYDTQAQRARPISELESAFSENGNFNVHPACHEQWWQGLSFPHFGAHFDGSFTATDWDSMNMAERQELLMCFRIAYLADSEVNWCPALGTVLANDEVKDGLSERGGHPVVKKTMRQWMMRITAYADRLLNSLDHLEWTDSVKEAQRHWIGRSEGASVRFAVANRDGQPDPSGAEVEVFTTRPDTLHGVAFMVLAPEHTLVESLTTEACRADVDAYIEAAGMKSERDRQGDKSISGVFTGGQVIHPLTGALVPVWIADYVLAGYGTGAIMAVPAGDERDWRFAKHFDLPIPAIFEGVDTNEAACTDKNATLCNSGEWNGLRAVDALSRAIEWVETHGCGARKRNYRIRDAVFSRQRYWGEPFPIMYEGGIPKRITDATVTLPQVDAYLPTEDGEPPLARASREDWPVFRGDAMETNTMPGWAGSSWYFLRYMDPHNNVTFCDREKSDYWGQVDLYVGGAEHTTGHLLYSRFWTKFLCDRGYIGFDEPFKSMINQGMILGRSNFVYRIQGTNTFVTASQRKDHHTQRLHVDINLVENDKLDLEGFRAWRTEFADADFILEDDGTYICGHEVEKMSKSKYNVQTPDDLVERYGADTLRCYEMFLGPLTQHKPWDTQGISGVHNFLRKIHRLYTGDNADLPEKSSEEALRIVHKAIAKVTDDLDRHAFNTVVSALMIAVNDLGALNTNLGRDALQPLAVLLSPYAPHLAEELWAASKGPGSVLDATWPEALQSYLTEDQITYPVSFNGKVRFQLALSASLSAQEVEASVRQDERTAAQLAGKDIRKVIVVPGRIVNVVA